METQKKFHIEKLQIQIPHQLEIVWALAKPKNEEAKFKKIILCSFYSPPRSKLRNKLKDHMIGTLQTLVSKYPECGIFIGGDKNKMNISPILSSNQKLRQIVKTGNPRCLYNKFVPILQCPTDYTPCPTRCARPRCAK